VSGIHTATCSLSLTDDPYSACVCSVTISYICIVCLLCKLVSIEIHHVMFGLQQLYLMWQHLSMTSLLAITMMLWQATTMMLAPRYFVPATHSAVVSKSW